jgi:acyl-CoA thioesterase FadM
LIAIAVEVESLGEHSVVFAYRLSGPDGELRATARLIHAFRSLDDFTPCGAPEALLAGLRQLALL